MPSIRAAALSRYFFILSPCCRNGIPAPRSAPAGRNPSAQRALRGEPLARCRSDQGADEDGAADEGDEGERDPGETTQQELLASAPTSSCANGCAARSNYLRATVIVAPSRRGR